MPVVTDIKQQKRHELLYNVYLDGDFSFALSDLDLSTSGLRVGHELTAQEVERFKGEAVRAKSYALALRWLGVRPRSVQEMRDYLRRKGVESELAESVVTKLRGQRLLDDRVFAATWIASRQALRPRSRRRLEQELAAKGLSRESIAAGLANLGSEDELTMLVGVIEKKRRLPQYQNPEKLMAYLARQGYQYDQIKKALTRLDD